MRGALPFMLGAEIGDGQERRSFEATLRYVNETKSVAIERFELFSGDATLCKIEISNADQLVSQAPTYNVIANGLALQDMPVKFAGLFPTAEHEQLSGILAEAHAIFSQAFTMPSYLGPFRAEPTRTMRQPSQNIRDLGPRGERALEFLADDRLRRGGQLSARVGEWFGQALGQSVHVDVTGEQPQIVVRPNNTELDISLADTGAGFSQSLPVVVQNLAFQDNRLPASMLIVEQPELHLHPAAHGALADLMISSANQQATCIAETHSEQFIMRLRRRIAEGFDHKKVVLWSLNHREADDSEPEPIRVVAFDENGNPDGWPIGVFEEALSDLTEMRRASRARPA